MKISAHDASNINYSKAGTGWQLGWTTQQLVVTGQVAATGGTYEVTAPKASKKTVRTRKN